MASVLTRRFPAAANPKENAGPARRMIVKVANQAVIANRFAGKPGRAGSHETNIPGAATAVPGFPVFSCA